jgi:hypothetical protein
MFTWTSETRSGRGFWLPAVLVLFLAGCFEAAPLSRFSAREAAPGPDRLAVGGVTVAGPDGYCVDTSSVVAGDSEAFVLLVGCRTDARRRPVLAATVTGLAADAATGAENLNALRTAVTGEAGRGLISRSGRAEHVRIDAAEVADGAIWLRIHDVGSPEAFAPDYWRAILPVADRVVSLSVLEARAAPGAAADGRAILGRFVERMRAANGT